MKIPVFCFIIILAFLITVFLSLFEEEKPEE